MRSRPATFWSGVEHQGGGGADGAPPRRALGKLEQQALTDEMKSDLNAYLATVPAGHTAGRTLAELIAFNRAHAEQEMALFGQDEFEAAEATQGEADPAYAQARAEARRMAGPDGIDAMLATRRVSVLVAPTLGPAWLTDPVLKDRFVGGSAGQAAAVAGYPPSPCPWPGGRPAGGASFVGPAWSEARLLGYGYAYEQASHAARKPTFAPTAVIQSEALVNAQAPKPPPATPPAREKA